jgi:hypothetical protein
VQFSLSPRVANLDALINVVFSRLIKRKELKQNQSFALLRQLLYKFFWQTRFNLFLGRNPWKAFAQVSHEALGAKLGISREWVQKLTKRLKAAGWIETYSPRRPDGKLREVTIFRPGPMLRQLLMTLLKSKQRDTNHVNETSQVFPGPHKEEQKATNKQTNSPIPSGLVDGLVKGLVKNVDMNTKIRW